MILGKRKIILARDRMGKKPLFYWFNENVFAFSSELKGLRHLPSFPNALNREALNCYIRLGYVPNWTCIYEGVSKLQPGYFLEWDLDRHTIIRKSAYWKLPEPWFDEDTAESDWVDQIESLLDDAVRIRLRSDVPLGIFLSGGIDSGLVAASAAKESGGDLASLTDRHPELGPG